jgi:hypothetical protein
VKEAFAKEARQAVVADDILVYKGALEETEMLYAAKVCDRARLTLHREDQSRTIEYECGGSLPGG